MAICFFVKFFAKIYIYFFLNMHKILIGKQVKKSQNG